MDLNHLPAYCAWLLGRIDAYTAEVVRLFRVSELSLLRSLARLPEEEQFRYSRVLNTEFLSNMSMGNAEGHIEMVTRRWKADRNLHISKWEVQAGDITIINHIRSKALKHFLNEYTEDHALISALHSEIDDLAFAYNNRSINDYFEVMKEGLGERERQLLEAQSIGKIGSYVWDIMNDQSVSTPQVRAIFETDHRQDLPEMLQHVHPADRQKVRDALGEAYRTGLFGCEFRYEAASGEKVIHSTGVVTFNEEGQPRHLTGTMQDITDRKRSEERLLQYTADLERSNLQLEEFASVASHDLKEPLRKIGIFTDIILGQSEELPEKVRANVVRINDAALRMQQLIEGVLSYSSVSGGVPEACDLEAVLQSVLLALEGRIEETGARITSDGLPVIEAVPFAMQQLLQNLVGNAVKFRRSGTPPAVQLTHRYEEGLSIQHRSALAGRQYLRIDVQDNGIGFPADAAEKIFGIFQRLHGRTEYEGSGIGLAICRRIAEQHGGFITAQSLSEGALFSVYLQSDRQSAIGNRE